MADGLFEGVGKCAHVDHVAVQTVYGRLDEATLLFVKLGYRVHPFRKARGVWGKAIFLVKDGSIPIQLTDSSAGLSIPICENHFAVVVDDPFTVSFRIRDWTRHGGVSAEAEEISGGKYFVFLPEVLTMPIELVPNPNICPVCGGKGAIRRVREGMGYDQPCNYCGGSGQDPHCR